MKRKTLFWITITIFGMALNIQAQSVNKKPVVEVLYFHATHRCPTCISIEANTRKTLETNFAKEMNDGKIKLTVLNAEEEKNKQIAEKYGAYGATLILVKTSGGKEISEDMTNFAFSYSRNQPDKFIDGLKTKIDELIK
jgi:hypothetical protein